MKISKSKLKRIVLEELQGVLSEQETTAAPEETLTRQAIKSLMPDDWSEEAKNWITTAGQVVDITGISGWEDAGRSFVALYEEPSLANLGWAALNGLAAMPFVGRFAAPAKALKLAEKTSEAAALLRRGAERAAHVGPDAAEAVRLADKLDDAVDSFRAVTSGGEDVTKAAAKAFSRDVSEAGEVLTRLMPGSRVLANDIAGLSSKVTRFGFSNWKWLGTRGLARSGKIAGQEFEGGVWTPPTTPDTGANLDDLRTTIDRHLNAPPAPSGGTPLGELPAGPGPAGALHHRPGRGGADRGGIATGVGPIPPWWSNWASQQTGARRQAGCNNQHVLHDAYEMYNALKGWGTDEEVVYRVIKQNSEPACMAALYRAFEEILRRKDDTDDGDLIDWLRDDGEDASAMKVKRGMISWAGKARSRKKTRKRRRRKK